MRGARAAPTSNRRRSCAAKAPTSIGIVCARFAGRTLWRMTTAAGHPSPATKLPTYTAWVLFLFTLVATFGFVDRIIVQVLVQPIKAELRVSDADMVLLGGLTCAVVYALLRFPIA